MITKLLLILALIIGQTTMIEANENDACPIDLCFGLDCNDY